MPPLSVAFDPATRWRFVQHRNGTYWCIAPTDVGPPFMSGCNQQHAVPRAELVLSVTATAVCWKCLGNWAQRRTHGTAFDFPLRDFQWLIQSLPPYRQQTIH